MTDEENVKLVEEHILLRLDPKIYAFTADTIPNYLKIGDTLRAVDTRLAEWEKLICERLGQKPVITKVGEFSALLSKDHYFRDYSVHAYLEGIGKRRIDGDLSRKYSVEFFENTGINDVEQAINDIKQDYAGKDINKKYLYYSVADNAHAEIHGANDMEWSLRPNQQEVVDNFLSRPDEKKLLMYAVMRFGKSFTAMYCALEKNARKVLIVSAKADVRGEWQKTVETPTCFKNYKFICDGDLHKKFDINGYLSENAENRVAVFLTLQNLCGKDSEGKDIKKRLKQIYETEFDLLIVDETHYGAWAHEYGKPIKDADEDVIEEEQREFVQFKNKVGKIKAAQQLHLSGTPYNLLYENKFTQDNIVAMCQYKDILTEKEKWDEKHFSDIEDNKVNPETGFAYQESDNPYFGFPQMLRFAFNLPASIREELRQSKSQWTLNDLFATTLRDGEVKFQHEAAVLSLLKAIDGSEENDDIFGFLNVPKIRDNDVCKHMVFALPFKYSCDAMELLLNKYKEQFINLRNYKVLNITGHNVKPCLDSVDKVKKHISECEKADPVIKTITLTVYKMLTGVTVKEWDTMIMLKNTQSPQEYDQAIFRIQNQFVKEYAAADGSRFKKDLKPQTILVDFDPVRMFNIQGLSTRVVNKVKGNVQSLEATIADDLRFSPIIAYNARNLVKVEPKNLIELILKYNREKSIIDDVKSVEWNASLLENSDLAAYIRSQNPNGLDNASTRTAAHEGEGESGFENPDEEDGSDGDANPENTRQGNTGNTDGNKDDKDIAKKYRMCIAKLAFFAFLSKSDIDSLQAVLGSLEPTSPYAADNARIFENLELDRKFIQGLIECISRADALGVDEVIKRANMLSKDGELSESERAANALNRFNRFSNSEIVTPNDIALNMCNLIGKDKLVERVNNGEKILDIASKAGEFTYALYSILKGSVEDEKLKNAIYSIPTSTTAYEFTRRIYEALGLNVECIAYGSKNTDEAMTSYDLLKIEKQAAKKTDKDTLDYQRIKSLLTQDKPFYSIKRNDAVTQGGKKVKFAAIVGNPPYQVTVKEATEGNNKNAVDIYQDFQNIALSMVDVSCLIYPAKEFQRGKANTLDKRLEYLRIYNGSSRQGEKHIPDEESVFGDIVRRIPGDVGVFLYNKNGENEQIIYQNNSIERTDKILPVWKNFLGIASKLSACAGTFVWSTVRKVCESNFVQYHKNSVLSEVADRTLPTPTGYTKVLTNDKAGSGGESKWYYIKTDDLDRKPVDRYKIVISSAYPNEAFVNDKNIELLDKDEAFGRSKLAIYDTDDKTKAENCRKYLSTKFAKCVNLMTPYKFLYYLPDFDSIYGDIDWSKSVDEIDKQLYQKYGLSDGEIAFIE